LITRLADLGDGGDQQTHVAPPPSAVVLICVIRVDQR